MRRSSLFAAVLATLALGVPTAQGASFVARLKTPKSQPRAGKSWRITVSARTSSGRKLHATAYYLFLYNGQVVSKQYPSPGHPGKRKSPLSFYGSYRDPIPFPARAVGFPLTFRVVVSVKGRGTRNLDKKIRVRK